MWRWLKTRNSCSEKSDHITFWTYLSKFHWDDYSVREISLCWFGSSLYNIQPFDRPLNNNNNITFDAGRKEIRVYEKDTNGNRRRIPRRGIKVSIEIKGERGLGRLGRSKINKSRRREWRFEIKAINGVEVIIDASNRNSTCLDRTLVHKSESKWRRDWNQRQVESFWIYWFASQAWSNCIS